MASSIFMKSIALVLLMLMSLLACENRAIHEGVQVPTRSERYDHCMIIRIPVRGLSRGALENEAVFKELRIARKPKSNARAIAAYLTDSERLHLEYIVFVWTDFENPHGLYDSVIVRKDDLFDFDLPDDSLFDKIVVSMSGVDAGEKTSQSMWKILNFEEQKMEPRKKE